MKRLLLPLLFLAACTSVPAPQAAMDSINRQFAGRDVNAFFTEFGAPVSSQPSGNGKTYRWLSLEPQGVSRPATVMTYPGGHFGQIGDNTNGEMVSGYCEISIRTGSDDKIEHMALVYDSTGKFSGSRCAEIFGLPPS